MSFLSTPFLAGISCERSEHTMVRVIIIIGGVSLMDGRTMTNNVCMKLPHYSRPAARFHSYRPLVSKAKTSTKTLLIAFMISH